MRARVEGPGAGFDSEGGGGAGCCLSLAAEASHPLSFAHGQAPPTIQRHPHLGAAAGVSPVCSAAMMVCGTSGGGGSGCPWRRGAPGGLRCAGGTGGSDVGGGAASGCSEWPLRADGRPSSPPRVASSASSIEAPAEPAAAAGPDGGRAVHRQSGAGEAAAWMVEVRGSSLAAQSGFKSRFCGKAQRGRLSERFCRRRPPAVKAPLHFPAPLCRPQPCSPEAWEAWRRGQAGQGLRLEGAELLWGRAVQPPTGWPCPQRGQEQFAAHLAGGAGLASSMTRSSLWLRGVCTAN